MTTCFIRIVKYFADILHTIFRLSKMQQQKLQKNNNQNKTMKKEVDSRKWTM